MKKHRILSLLLAAIMLIPANVTALAYDRTSKEPPSSTERVEQLRDSGLEPLESTAPIEPAEEITVLDVANAIDGDKRIFECREIRQRLAVFEEHPPQWACEGICGVRSVMDMAQQRMEEALGQHTILDLARKMYRKAPDTFVVEVQEWIDARKG